MIFCIKHNNTKFILIVFYLFFAALKTQAQINATYVKAGLLNKILQYISWEHADEDTLHVAFWGNTELKEAFDVFAEQAPSTQWEIITLTINDENIHHDFHILFIDKSHIREYLKNKEKLHKRKLLLFSDCESAHQSVVHISFYKTEQNTIHFGLNKKLISRDKFIIDRVLLNIAKII